MTTTIIDQLEDKVRLYLNEVEHIYKRLDLAKDKMLIRDLKSDKRYQLFRPKILSLRATRNEGQSWIF